MEDAIRHYKVGVEIRITSCSCAQSLITPYLSCFVIHFPFAELLEKLFLDEHVVLSVTNIMDSNGSYILP